LLQEIAKDADEIKLIDGRLEILATVEIEREAGESI